MGSSLTIFHSELIKEGTFKTVVDSEFRFVDVLEAYDRLTSKKAIGRVVVNVGGIE